jgi:hypothetical protein
MLLESCQAGARVAPLSLKAIGAARIAAENYFLSSGPVVSSLAGLG